jgi:hypothetical protein
MFTCVCIVNMAGNKTTGCELQCVSANVSEADRCTALGCMTGIA